MIQNFGEGPYALTSTATLSSNPRNSRWDGIIVEPNILGSQTARVPLPSRVAPLDSARKLMSGAIDLIRKNWGDTFDIFFWIPYPTWGTDGFAIGHSEG